MKIIKNLYNEIISTENLFLAWEEFSRSKRSKGDVQEFEFDLEKNIFEIHRQLKRGTYKHGAYQSFYITDPKQRHIHKAQVCDRVIHHALYRNLYPLYDPTFIPTSFSCRNNKGTHRGVLWLEKITRKVSQNHTRQCYVLKCDIRKFFNSIDHDILLKILGKRIKDKKLMDVLENIVHSFNLSQSNLFERKGVPLGNLTSQLFANIYMNELDQFMKHELRVKYYARYTDDFVIVSHSEEHLPSLFQHISDFLDTKLKLELHPNKVAIHKLHNGIDFLGYIVRPHHKLIRTKTKNRMMRKFEEQVRLYRSGEIDEETLNVTLQSYLGVLSHADAHKVEQQLKNRIIF